ncbi:MAG: hypothetical protein IJ282_00560 [Lachnospiraceae bacterium]|nr:hypothetical protein [Lachnospiraceae bacterium]
MSTESYWQQFTVSGKIEDYLNYSRMKQEESKSAAKGEQKGERPYAGSDYGNRNDFKSDAYR